MKKAIIALSGGIDSAVAAAIAKDQGYELYFLTVNYGQKNIEKELERLKNEEKKLEGELKRVNGMLANEKFVSKAPQAKIDEEKAKLEKYTNMMEQVKERIAQLSK